MNTHRAPLIENTPDGTRVTMFADRAGILLAVVAGWAAMGGAMAAVSFAGLTDASSPDRWWSLIILALGLANLLPAVVFGLFVLDGREIVVVGPLRLTRRAQALGMGRTWVYDGPVSHVYNRGIRLSGPQSFLVFHVGAKRIRLGTGMTESEAAGVVAELRDRYPEMRPEGFIPSRPRTP